MNKKIFICVLMICLIAFSFNGYSMANFEEQINFNEKEFCNYKPDIKCKDITIVVFEYYTSDIMQKIANEPIRMSSKSKYNINDVRKYNHPYKVVSIIRNLCPEAKIYFLPQTNIGVEKAIELDVDICNFSASDFHADDELEKKLSENAIMFTSAGNQGSNGETSAATKEWWIAIGDCRYDVRLEEPVLAKTSSHGKGHVFTCGFSNIQYSKGSSNVYGSSFSSAMVTSLTAQYYQAFYDEFGIKPTPEQAKEFIKNNCYNLNGNKKDIKTGYGVFRLPEEFDFSE